MTHDPLCPRSKSMLRSCQCHLIQAVYANALAAIKAEDERWIGHDNGPNFGFGIDVARQAVEVAAGLAEPIEDDE